MGMTVVPNGRPERLASAAARDAERLDAARHGSCSWMGMPAPAGRAPGCDGLRVRQALAIITLMLWPLHRRVLHVRL